MKPLMILSVTLVTSIVLMLGSGIVLFDSIERETITVEPEELDSDSVVCEGTEALLVPLEAVGTMLSKVENVSVKIGVCSDEQAIQRLLDGQIDIALTTRLPTAVERELAQKKKLVLWPLVVANEKLSLVVSMEHSEDGLTSVRRNVASQIFGSGEVLTWASLVPNAKGEIRPMMLRDCGVSNALVKGLALSDSTVGENVVQVGDSTLLRAQVADDRLALAVMPMRQIDDQVRGLRLEGPKGHAPLHRPLYMLVTNGRQSVACQRFVEFTLSKLGQNVVRIDGLMSYRK